MTKDELLLLIRDKDSEMTLREKLRLTVLLSIPAIIAQVSYVLMEMIDAAMLGHLSTDDAAAVGLVSTTIWLFGGLTSAFSAGFYVQVAHCVGANNIYGTRRVIRQGLASGLSFGLVLAAIGFLVSPYLPHWLGATERICAASTEYFQIFCCGLPVIIINSLAAGCLRCSGNVKIPSALLIMMCVLDVIFNYIFIFLCDMRTAGAALGTLVAYTTSAVLMVYALVMKDKVLGWKDHTFLLERPRKKVLSKALRIGFPMSMDRSLICFAQIAISGIIAPLGTLAIAANSFAINVESLCYMPGYGISEAATTLVGQSKGAGRPQLMRNFAAITVTLGVMVMAVMGAVMWIFAPEMMQWITPDTDVIRLGSEILRIEAWAEPGFAAAIVANGVFIGAGKTLASSIMNLFSIWGVRVSLTLLLAPTYGLHGVWIAMAAELCFRGTIFVLRLIAFRHRWTS